MIEKLIDKINADFSNYEKGKGIATTCCIIMLLENLFPGKLIDKINLLEALKEQLIEEDQNEII